jgi:hypothetical protein
LGRWRIRVLEQDELGPFGMALCFGASIGPTGGDTTKAWLNEGMIQRLIPKIFYNHLSEGLDLFVGCLGFKVSFRDETLAVVERDGAKTYVVESAEYAAKDRPEIALETDTIHELYDEIKARRPEMLHPNLSEIRRQPWGPLEFAVLDKTTVCVVFRQW